MALQLGLDLADEPQPGTARGDCADTLARRGRLLVLLDDLWDVDLGRWLLAEALPAERALLITSRDLAVCRALCAHVERLGVLPEGGSARAAGQPPGRPRRDTRRRPQSIIQLLDGLPLALELAARLCDEGAADLPWLLRRLRGKPALDILQAGGPGSRGRAAWRPAWP